MAAHRPLDQQVILITGASSGIGLCTALAAAEAGARVVLVARSSGILQEVAALLTEQGHQAIAVVADVADPAQLQHAADAALARFGRIDTWVNNAGVAIFGLLQGGRPRQSPHVRYQFLGRGLRFAHCIAAPGGQWWRAHQSGQ
ncbi:NADP-dependent 3-hydroxy acid dehydrogenase YdfG [Xanthomonas arboricola]